MRLTARQLVNILCDSKGLQIHSADMRDFVIKYAASRELSIYCDKCSALITDIGPLQNLLLW